MNKNVQNIAQGLKDKIVGNQLITNEIFDFASNYAVDRSLVNDAIFLQFEGNMAESDTEKEDIRLKLLHLVDTIALDYDQHKDSELASQNKVLEDKAMSNFIKFKKDKEVVVVMKDIEKQYKKNGFKLVVNKATFKLGEITGIVGANANGKSTLLKIIVGELLQNKGTIKYPYFDKRLGNKVDWNSIKTQIAYVPQELPQWFGTVRENLHFEALLHGIKGKKNELEVHYILERLGLMDYADTSWEELSGGFKLRFALAKALVWKPKLLVMDEPLANLDIISQMVVLNDIKALAHSYSYPFCVILTSQHIHEIENISDNIIVINNGDIVYDGTIAEYGINRQQNIFEIITKESIEDLLVKLEGLGIQRIEKQGFYSIIYTPLSIDAADIVHELNTRHIDFDYFRNISQSVKKEFYEPKKIPST